MDDPALTGLRNLATDARDFFADVIGAAIPIVTPRDRQAPEGPPNFPVKAPSVGGVAKTLKTIAGGTKSITVDQVLQIYGAQPLSGRDQVDTPAMQISDAAHGIVFREFRGRVRLSDVGLLSDAEKQQILGNIRRDANVRQLIASTPDGQQFLSSFGIGLSVTDQIAAAALADTRAIAAKKDGGLNGIVAAQQGIGNLVVDAITALERLFAANPPDP